MNKKDFEQYLNTVVASENTRKHYLRELDKFLPNGKYHNRLNGINSIYELNSLADLDEIYKRIVAVTENGAFVRSALNHLRVYMRETLNGNGTPVQVPQEIDENSVSDGNNGNIPERLSKLINLLKANYNLILTGAPGTGKTYLAKEIASHLTGNKANGNIGFVQFHPSYDYTDFVEGLRPISEECETPLYAHQSEIKFTRVDGTFMDFCRTAIQNPTEKYVFIIDEINRGEISKILGELFYAIDPGYRGEEGRVTTQYNNLMKRDDEFKTGFYIPENVYIIGTMNDIDRSVDSFDFAIRRRFAWKEIKAEDSAKDIIIGSIKDEKLSTDLLKVLSKVNQSLESAGLTSDYHLGGAYFAKISQYLNAQNDNLDEAMQLLWDNHLEGVIKEYFRGLPDAVEKTNMVYNAYLEAENEINRVVEAPNVDSVPVDYDPSLEVNN